MFTRAAWGSQRHRMRCYFYVADPVSWGGLRELGDRFRPHLATHSMGLGGRCRRVRSIAAASSHDLRGVDRVGRDSDVAWCATRRGGSGRAATAPRRSIRRADVSHIVGWITPHWRVVTRVGQWDTRRTSQVEEVGQPSGFIDVGLAKAHDLPGVWAGYVDGIQQSRVDVADHPGIGPDCRRDGGNLMSISDESAQN